MHINKLVISSCLLLALSACDNKDKPASTQPAETSQPSAVINAVTDIARPDIKVGKEVIADLECEAKHYGNHDAASACKEKLKEKSDK